jgi:hypothetical protein
VTTSLSDKQLLDAYNRAFDMAAGRHFSMRQGMGLRAVADLAITQQEADNAGQAVEIERLRMELTLAQKR